MSVICCPNFLARESRIFRSHLCRYCSGGKTESGVEQIVVFCDSIGFRNTRHDHCVCNIVLWCSDAHGESVVHVVCIHSSC